MLNPLVVLTKRIRYNGQPAIVACDGKCSKAWGRCSRPSQQLSEDELDVEWLADHELGEAPSNPGTAEGRDVKPTHEGEELNTWCVRECERSDFAPELEQLKLRDFSQRHRRYPAGEQQCP